MKFDDISIVKLSMDFRILFGLVGECLNHARNSIPAKELINNGEENNRASSDTWENKEI